MLGHGGNAWPCFWEHRENSPAQSLKSVTTVADSTGRHQAPWSGEARRDQSARGKSAEVTRSDPFCDPEFIPGIAGLLRTDYSTMTDDFLSVKASTSPQPRRNSGNLVLIVAEQILGQPQRDLPRATPPNTPGAPPQHSGCPPQHSGCPPASQPRRG